MCILRSQLRNPTDIARTSHALIPLDLWRYISHPCRWSPQALPALFVHYAGTAFINDGLHILTFFNHHFPLHIDHPSLSFPLLASSPSQAPHISVSLPLPNPHLTVNSLYISIPEQNATLRPRHPHGRWPHHRLRNCTHPGLALTRQPSRSPALAFRIIRPRLLPARVIRRRRPSRLQDRYICGCTRQSVRGNKIPRRIQRPAAEARHLEHQTQPQSAV